MSLDRSPIGTSVGFGCVKLRTPAGQNHLSWPPNSSHHTHPPPKIHEDLVLSHAKLIGLGILCCFPRCFFSIMGR